MTEPKALWAVTVRDRIVAVRAFLGFLPLRWVVTPGIAGMEYKSQKCYDRFQYKVLKGKYMYVRKKILLSLLNNSKKPATRLQMVKWAFLLANEFKHPQLKSFYTFVPYKFGPFSFSLYRDLDGLIDNTYIKSDSKGSLSLSQKVAAPKVEGKLALDIALFIRKYKKLSDKDLKKYVYKNYPWYTINASNQKHRLESRPNADNAIYTAGYESLQVDEFMNLLLKNGIHQLIDVRNNPVARRYGFHKKTISYICKQLEIDYFHFPQLGIQSKIRFKLLSKDDYSTLFKIYKEEILSNETKAIQKVADMVKEKASVLVCMEADNNYCHRKLLAQGVEKLTSLPLIELRN